MSNCKEHKEVVSIVVVTYNSAKYVRDTLESIKSQTYPYLSLIVTDDCSQDKTVVICRNWIQKNRERFVEAVLLTSDVNTGVSANGNRGERACKTRWVKGIAGDDILLPNCIEDNIHYVQNHIDTVLLFSKIKAFGVSSKRLQNVESNFYYPFFDFSSKAQLEHLIFAGNSIPASTLFYDVNVLRLHSISNDERISMLEDWPKWINCLRAGLKFSFLDKTTVLYRVSDKSLSTSPLQSVKFFRSLRLFYYIYQRDCFVQRYGEEHTSMMDLEFTMKIYSDYYYYRNLPASKWYFFFKHINQRIKDFFVKKKKVLHI